MSRVAVSCEHLASFAHFDEVSLPSNPSSKRLTTFRCRSLNDSPAMSFPEPGFPEHARQGRLRAVEGAVQAAEEPLHPRRDVEVALLGRFQDVVIVVPLQPDLGRHAVEAFRALLGARERQVGDRAGDAPVAVVERVDGHEPEMRRGRP